MSPHPRHRRRPTATALTALAAGALAIPLLAACGALDTAVSCAKTATAVVDSVDKLQQAAGNAAENPQDAEKALNDIDKNLDKLGDSTGDPDLTKAVDKMHQGIENARQAVEQNKNPDLQPIADAAGELTKVCTPG